ncbi:MAG: hypothetical protein Q8M03_00190, partial [Legionella sp.]|nr:hypothetical protein [Legionella sp.]
VPKLCLESGSQQSSSIQDMPQPSKTLIMSTNSSVEIDPSTMEDKVLFPLIRGMVNREERRSLMFSMSHEQTGRFIAWNEELAARKEKLRLLQEEYAVIQEKTAELKAQMSNTIATYSEQSFHEITSGTERPHKIVVLNQVNAVSS